MNEPLPQQSIPAEELQRAWQQSLAEILGETKENESFTHAGLLNTITRIRQKYGAQAADGLLLRLGRSLARNLLPWVCANTHATERLAPRSQKILKTARRMAEALSFLQNAAPQVTLKTRSLEVKLPASASEMAAFWAGLFQETTYWASGGQLRPTFTGAEDGAAVIRIHL